ncbi:uncharacterized protein LOC132652461 isoform X3 [Meriones unguiculatus]|uniref:uncharacterized protein LOC132652461 isoform X3 n=1 Tax=Meriones unguiculatus TaxID=10047 RepID=UPI00293EB5D8|nr:uncharacterized protein LOC132652461 isoform X3 [Meriones unguiculatus]
MEEEGEVGSSFNSFCPVRSDAAWADKRLREPSRSGLFYLPIKVLQDNTLIWHGRIELRNFILLKTHLRESDVLLWSESSDMSCKTKKDLIFRLLGPSILSALGSMRSLPRGPGAGRTMLSNIPSWP